MHPKPCVSAVPRWMRALTYTSLLAAAAAAATQAMGGPTHRGGLPFPPLAPLPDGETDDERARKAFVAEFAAAEEIVQHRDEKSSGDLRKARQTLTDLEATDVRFGAEYPERIKELKAKLDDALVGRLCKEAKELAAAEGTTPSQGLAKFAEAEDFVRKALVDAKRTKAPAEPAYQEAYKRLLADSDAYTKRVITKEFIESIPWTDLLGADMEQKWSKTTTVPGFSCRIENGVVTITPPDAGSKMQGVCAVLDQKNENLRHFVLDMQFEVEGVATIFFHVSPPPQNPDNRQSETYDLSAKEGGPLRPNERCSLVATYIGSDLTVWFPENDEVQRYENTPNWAKLRRGGIAFLIPEGTRLTITRMRIRELR